MAIANIKNTVLRRVTLAAYVLLIYPFVIFESTRHPRYSVAIKDWHRLFRIGWNGEAKP